MKALTNHLQWLVLLVVASFLTACGGGGGGSADTSIPLVGASSYGLTATSTTAAVTGTNPAVITATLTTPSGAVAAGESLTFTTNAGNLTSSTSSTGSSSVTLMTNAQGEASVTLNAGTVANTNGTVTIRFVDSGGNVKTFDVEFSTDGTEVTRTTSTTPVYSLVLAVVDSTGAAVGTSGNPIKYANPGTVTATLLKNNSPLTGQVVTFTSQVGVLSPASGTVLTNTSGVATIALTAGTVAGAGQLTAQAVINGTTVSATPVNIETLGDAPATTVVANPYALTVAVVDSTGATLGTTGNPLEFSNPGTVIATLTQTTATGTMPVAGQVVTFTTQVGVLNPTLGTALTDNNGHAIIAITAGTVQGAGQVTASTTITGTTTSVVATPDNIYTLGDTPTTGGTGTTSSYVLTLGMTDSGGNVLGTAARPLDNANPGTVTATLTQKGKPVPNQIVTFTTNNFGVLTPSSGTALTDANGEAKVTITAGTVKGAGQLTATTTISGTSTQVTTTTYDFETLGDAAVQSTAETLTLSITDSNNNVLGSPSNPLSFADPGTITATLMQGSQPLSNVVVRFNEVNSDGGAGGGDSLSAATAITDANGVATVAISTGNEGKQINILDATVYSTGDSPVVVAFASQSVVSLGDLPPNVVGSYELSLAATAGGATVGTVAKPLVAGTPGSLVATLKNGSTPVVNQLVTLSKPAYAVITPASLTALTDANGNATFQIAAGSTAGVDSLVATTSVGVNTLSDAINVESTGGSTNTSSNTLTIALTDAKGNQLGTDANPLAFASPGTLTATLESNGTPVANAIVIFSSTVGVLGTTSALTDANGHASVTLTAGTVNGPGTITASSALNSGTVSALPLNITSKGDAPANAYSLSVTVVDGSSNQLGTAGSPVRNSDPGTVSATLELNGSPVANQVVTFTASGVVGNLTPTTAVTDSNGVATIAITAGTVAGAGEISASSSPIGAGTTVTSSPVSVETMGDGTGSGNTLALAITDGGGAVLGTTGNPLKFSNPGTITATLMSGGAPVANQVVHFTTQIGVLNPASGTAITNSSGVATIAITAGAVAGAGQISATADDGNATVSAVPISIESAGDAPASSYALTLALTDSKSNQLGTVSNPLKSINPGTLKAVLTQNGSPVVNQVVNFSSAVGVLNPLAGTALTDSTGTATISLTAGTVAGAGLVNASVSTSTGTVAAVPLSIQTLGDAATSSYTLAITSVLDSTNTAVGTSTNPLKYTKPGTITATLLLNGTAVPNQVVSFASQVGTLSPASGTAITDTSGHATIAITAGTIAGAGQITASFTSNLGSVSATPVSIQTLGDTPASPYTLTLASSAGTATNLISSTNPAAVTATLMNGTTPVANQLVTFASQVGVLSPTTAVTNASGVATVSVTAGTVAGAGQVTASAVAGTQSVTATPISIATKGDALASATLTLNVVDSSGNAYVAGTNPLKSANPGVVTATLVQNGTPIANQVVTFATQIGVLSPASGTAVTNAAGVATVSLTAGTLAGAGQVSATTTLSSGVIAAAPVSIQSLGDGTLTPYALTLSVVDGSSTALGTVGNPLKNSNPGSLVAKLTDNGVPVANQLVTFTSAVGVLNPVSGVVLTDSTGTATVAITAGSVAGAGQVTAVASINGGGSVTATPVSIKTLGDAPVSTYSLGLALTDSTGTTLGTQAYPLNAAHPGTITATLLLNGSPVPNQVVTIASQVGVLNPIAGTAITNSAGQASITITTGTVAGVGQISATSTSNGGTVTATPINVVNTGDASSNYTLSLSVVETSDGKTPVGTSTNPLSAAEPGTIIAVLKDNTGAPVANQVVDFSSAVGVLNPISGQALTDGTGTATISITAGTVAGAGQVTATYTDPSGTITATPVSVETKGDDAALGYTLTLSVADSSGNPVGTSGAPITAKTPGYITATLEQNGTAVANQVVSFSSQVGVLNPIGGTVITNGLGQATIELTAGTVAGAGLVSATSVSNTGSVSATPIAVQTSGNAVSAYTLTLSITDSSSAQLGTTSNQLRAANPGTVQATLLDNGVAVPNAIVTFGSQLGVLNPTSGTALTNAKGVATVNITAGTVAGAGQVTATYNSPNGAVTAAPVSIETLGDATVAASTGTGYKLSLTLENQTETSSLSAITGTSPGVLVATLTDSNGNAQNGQVITFTSNLGVINPVSGTALTGLDSVTNTQGVAKVNLNAGTIAGAGTVTATFGTGTVATVNFSTDGTGQASPNLPNLSIVGFEKSSCNTKGTNVVTSSCNGILEVNLTTSGGTAIPNQVITFTNALTTLPISINPTSGTALTDSSGNATVVVGANGQSGAGTINVSTTYEGNTVTGSYNFQAQQDTLAIGNGTGGTFTSGALQLLNYTAPMTQGSTISVTADVVDVTGGNTAVTTPYVVSFSTACATSKVDSTVTTQSGVATATYTAGTDCTSDLITASVNLNGSVKTATAAVSVSSVPAATINFISASPQVIAIHGTGGVSGVPETSSVVFKVLDTLGNPVPNQSVSFGLSTVAGGIEFTNTGGAPAATMSSTTNSSGEVTAIVQSGTVATPVRVTAQVTLTGGVVINAVSSVLSVSTGLPSQDNFSIAVSQHNPRAGDYDGTTVTVTAFAADEFNNPVPDGTAIQFYAEIGSIGPQCTTVGGTCTVTWTSEGSRSATAETNRAAVTTQAGTNFVSMTGAQTSLQGLPSQVAAGMNDRVGRATIMAFALGEESYQDVNGTGVFDVNDPIYAELPDAFVDFAEEGVFDTNLAIQEKFVTFGATCGASPNPACYQPADTKYHGLLCTAAAIKAGDCASLIDVRASNVIDMATDNDQIYVFSGSYQSSYTTSASKTVGADWYDPSSTQVWNATGTPAFTNTLASVTQVAPQSNDQAIYDFWTDKNYFVAANVANPNQTISYSGVQASNGLSMTVLFADLNGNAPEVGSTVTVSGGGFAVAGACKVGDALSPAVCQFQLSAGTTTPTAYTPVVFTVTPANGTAYTVSIPEVP